MSDALGSQLAQLLGLAFLLALGAVIIVSVSDDRARNVLARVRAVSETATRIETPARRTLPAFGPLTWIPAVNAAADTLLVLAGDTLFAFDRISVRGTVRYLYSQKDSWAGDICLDVEATELMVIDDVSRSANALEFRLLAGNSQAGGRIQIGAAMSVGFQIPDDLARDAIFERLAPPPEEDSEALSPITADPEHS